MKQDYKILLVNPPWLRLFGQMLDSCPVGLSYLAAGLEKEGFNVSIYNADYNYKKLGLIFGNLKKMTGAYQKYLHTLQDLDDPLWQEVKKVISAQAPDMVGITCVTGSYGSAINVARLVKAINPDIPVVMGGIHPTIATESVLGNEVVDIVVRGEGDYTLTQLAAAMQTQGSLANITGISYKVQGKIVRNPDRPQIANLDDLPFPAKHLLLEKETYPSRAFGRLSTSRGCPYHCIYCEAHALWTRTVRFRSPENVVQEIEQTKKTFGTRHFYFHDDTFTLNERRVTTIFDLLIAKDLGISWGCETRADRVNPDLARKMKRAGCEYCNIGVESGDAATLIRIKKGVTIEQVRTACQTLKDAGIAFNAFFMIGFPWETAAEVKKTVALMQELNPERAFLSVVTPYPGSELYEICKAEGLIPDNFDWSTFFHQSPSMYLTRQLTREESAELIRYATEIFDRHNIRHMIKLILRH
ncbi:MAG: radical SAM protein, partial [Dehalococcoidia bacterium]|nr:radical SAM protein [Dehalococcoidia bacterium]